MPDTPRSMSILQLLLATNGTGQITAQQIRDFLVSVDPEDAITKGTVASLPSNTKAGWLRLFTNGFLIARDNASTWDYWGPIFPLSPPVDSGFSWVNQGSSTVTTTNGGIVLYQPGHAGDSLSCYVKSSPSTPWTLTVHQRAALYPGNSCQAGLCFRESSSGKIASLHVGFTGGGWAIQSTKWNSATSFSANYVTASSAGYVPRWLRIADDGSNRICSYSDDGVNFLAYHSIGRTDFLTADQAGFFVSAGGGTSKDAYQTILHFAFA